MRNRNEQAIQAAHHSGRATVMHAMVNGLLAAQRLSKAEVLAFFKTVRGALEEEVTNTRRVQAGLLDAGYEEGARCQIVSAFREAIELQLRLIETEISDSCAGSTERRAPF